MEKDKNFQRAMKYILSVEGGYSNNKYDKGGSTNFGITQRTYDFYRKSKNLNLQSVKNISKQEVETIYYEQYWKASGANKINDFSLALLLFDSSVNHGVTTAKRLYIKSNGNFVTFLNLRKEVYMKIVQKNPSQKIFLRGWLNRINTLQNFLK